MRTVESFDKHSILLLLPFFSARIHTEENKKQEPCRQHSTMSLIKYQNQYLKIWIILKAIIFYQKKYTQKSANSPKRYPKIWEQPKKVPKIMAHPRITTYASYPPPPSEFFLKNFQHTQFYRIKVEVIRGAPPLIILEWQTLPPINYILLENDFNIEQDSS